MSGQAAKLPAATVLCIADLDAERISALLSRYAAVWVQLPDHAEISGSYWGEPEAGLVGNKVYLRSDTPVHSLLHELCHYICMSAERRRVLSRDAGGDSREECAVCYLQVLLAEHFLELGRTRCFEDMDAWGYSFREGSAAAWFHGDGQFARQWLLDRGLIDANGRPTTTLCQVL